MSLKETLDKSHPTKCYQEKDVSCLLVETSDKNFVFPYAQLLNIEGNNSDIKISFTTHDVELNGSNLLILLPVFQRFSVEWVKAFPKKFEAFSKDQVYISSIVVNEINQTEE